MVSRKITQGQPQSIRKLVAFEKKEVEGSGRTKEESLLTHAGLPEGGESYVPDLRRCGTNW